MLDKHFIPHDHDQRIYAETESFFVADPSSSKPAYTIMMPPPNITGSLHLGHALNDTLQDILARYHRKKGYDVLWQPGQDHAGIATQMVVEKQLKEQGLTRHDLGREKFIEKVWQWRAESGDTIMSQKRCLCISPDWQRSRFTMDAGLSKAVVRVFKTLYDKGLIYKDKRLVNWDTYFQTALSDLEVENREQKGTLYYIRYVLANDHQTITVATTRPETMFGDTAIAVHPDDERFANLIGEKARIPFTNRFIPIIADSYCDPSKGSGAVKITPAHDMNDFVVGKRHDLPLITVIDEKGFLAGDHVPSDYRGLVVKEGRAKIVHDLGDALVKEDPIQHIVPYSDRSGVEIQPRLTDQWFLNTAALVEPAINVVKEGKIQFFPKQWENTYFEWLNNIQPWCISRQIWWGHQIPAWYGPSGTVFVAESYEAALAEAVQHFGHAVPLTQDEDVLDTWFSSALWPFTTLGWPDHTPELKRYYPTAVLTTGFDIIFFWVARMIMMGLHFMDEIPFKTVYIHGLIRDTKGQKMSKSKGNIIDPLDLINKFGADALRFTLAKYATPGRDIKIGDERVSHSRNFLTKIWNAAKFLENMGGYDSQNALDIDNIQHPLNRWILHKLGTMNTHIHNALQDYRFDVAINELYHFFWDFYCDVYIETLKPLLTQELATQDLLTQEAVQREVRATAHYVFQEFLNSANPFIPVITEVLHHHFTAQSLVQKPIKALKDIGDDKLIDRLLGFVYEIRSLKGLMGIQTPVSIAYQAEQEFTQHLQDHWAWISHLGRLNECQKSEQNTGIPFVYEGITFVLQVDKGDIAKILAEKQKILDNEIKHLSKKLSNHAFQSAKPDLYHEDTLLYQSKMADFDKISLILGSNQ